MITKLEKMREARGLSIMGLALKMIEIDPSYERPLLVETLLTIEQEHIKSDETGYMVTVVAKALNCTVDEITEE